MTLTGVLLCVEQPSRIDFDCNIELHVLESETEKDSIVGIVGGSARGNPPPVMKMGLDKTLPHGVPLTFYNKVVPLPGTKGNTFGLKSLRDTEFEVQVSGYSD